jgi:hypothetical protein
MTRSVKTRLIVAESVETGTKMTKLVMVSKKQEGGERLGGLDFH